MKQTQTAAGILKRSTGIAFLQWAHRAARIRNSQSIHPFGDLFCIITLENELYVVLS